MQFIILLSQSHFFLFVPGSHDIYSMRDMRDALGALGPVDGQNPELNNLTCSLTYCDPGDIVFLTSDGISDNFDPVVGKFAIPKKEKEAKSSSREGQSGEKAAPSKEAGEHFNGTHSAQTDASQTQSSSVKEPRGVAQGRRNGERQQASRQHSQPQPRGSRGRKSQQGGRESTQGPPQGGKQVSVNSFKSLYVLLSELQYPLSCFEILYWVI